MLLNAIICDAYHCQHILISQYISFWSLWYLFSSRQLLPTPKNLKHRLSYLAKLHLPLSESKDQEKVSLPYIQWPFRNITAIRADTCPSKYHWDKTSEFLESVYSRVVSMVHFVFLCSSNATPDPLPLLCITCLTFLLNIFWAIHKEFLLVSVLTKLAKFLKKSVAEFFQKSCCLTASKFVEVEPTISVFLGITDIIFWGIFWNGYYMESWRWNPSK